MRIFLAVSIQSPCTTSEVIMNRVVGILMARDGKTEQEAIDDVVEMRNMITEGSDPEEVLSDWGLESDYVFDII